MSQGGIFVIKLGELECCQYELKTSRFPVRSLWRCLQTSYIQGISMVYSIYYNNNLFNEGKK